MWEVILAHPDFFLFVILITVGYITGRIAEAGHYRSIKQRELKFKDILVFTNRFPPDASLTQNAQLVVGSVVISEDYFKQVVAGLQTLFGGTLRSYESLLDRARREAVLRMKEEAYRRKSRMIINVKFQTFAVLGRSVGAVELLAYGTALSPIIFST
jgi:uncharacterized protein YbjQ (UPF0145 family)